MAVRQGARRWLNPRAGASDLQRSRDSVGRLLPVWCVVLADFKLLPWQAAEPIRTSNFLWSGPTRAQPALRGGVHQVIEELSEGHGGVHAVRELEAARLVHGDALEDTDF